MKYFAFIKEHGDLKIVNGSDIEKKADLCVRNNINLYLNNIINEYGENYSLTISDLEVLAKSSDYFDSNAYRVLNRFINNKKKNEVNRILSDLLEIYGLDEELVDYFVNNSTVINGFYTNSKGNISYDEKINVIFTEIFGDFVGEDLSDRLNMLVDSSDYNLDYSVSELKSLVATTSPLIKVSRENFETLMYHFGIVSNPRGPVFGRHLCYNCKKLSPLTCQKAKYYKKMIGHYSFITDGYQAFAATDNAVSMATSNNASMINSDDVEMISFIVENCENYSRSIDNEDYSNVSKVRKKNRRKG